MTLTDTGLKSYRFAKDRSKTTSLLAGFYVVAAKASFTAMLIVLIINLATPFEFSRNRLMELVDSGLAGGIALRFAVLMLVTSFACVPLMAIIGQYLKPVNRFLKSPDPDDTLRKSAGRRLINLPFLMVPVNLVLWTLIPGTLFFLVFKFGAMDKSTAFTFAIRAFMVGIMSCATLFFGLEAHARKKLIPMVFPEGQLAEASGTRRFSIGMRIRTFYRLGGLIPLALIVLTLFVLDLQIDHTTMTHREFSRSILIFSLVIFCISFLCSGFFSRLISRSIANPVNEMVKAVNAIKKGDYTTRVKVVSNDETGILGDAFNRAVNGLADRQRIREAFGRYVDPRVRDEILSGRIPLDGEYKQVTVLFSDLRGFTPLTAAHDPKTMVTLLNNYFEAMAAAVQENNGLILQFIGDEIYAVFGAPVTDTEHPVNAVNAAFDMERRLKDLNRTHSRAQLPGLSHGIGIHTGRVLAANIGSPDRLSYLLVGEAVNLAARLQAMTREFDARIIVSNHTMAHVSSVPAGLCAHPDPVRLKGIQHPVKIFKI